jgi:hypothetical protein
MEKGNHLDDDGDKWAAKLKELMEESKSFSE